jgi:dethiobiotin synthetase
MAPIPRTFFITGTNTGVGKTVLTVLLTEYLRRRRARVAALKPLCSGGRADARQLYRALGGSLALDQINPWYFRAAIAPSAAARAENRAVRLATVVQHIRSIQPGYDFLLVEGAGGLLSPLGAGFNGRDLISALDAIPVVVASNRLGVVNHILLTLEALPKPARRQARIVLMAPSRPDPATGLNAGLLQGLVPQPVFLLPRFDRKTAPAARLRSPRLRSVLEKILGG